MGVVNEAQQRRIRSHLLSDPLVRSLLAGYLAAGLRDAHRVRVSAAAVDAMLERYVAGTDLLLGPAAALFDAGYRAPDREG